MRSILIRVWQGELTPGQALNAIQDEFIGDKLILRKLKKDEAWVMYELDALAERAITVNEVEGEIKWIVNHKSGLCQAN